MTLGSTKDVKVVSLDLDNTLWDIGPTLMAAEQAVKDWLLRHCPAVVPLYTLERLSDVRQLLIDSNPDKAHDLSFMRRCMLKSLMEEAGCDPDLAEPAFQVFFAARNRVSLFEDVLPELEALSRHFVLVALTDGNAKLSAVGLSRYFKHYVNAASVGAAKPDPRMFQAVSEMTGCALDEIVHVGDDPEKDVAGANRIGVGAVWINRTSSAWPEHHPRPDVEMTSLRGLSENLTHGR